MLRLLQTLRVSAAGRGIAEKDLYAVRDSR